jgi:hypothetical protein
VVFLGCGLSAKNLLGGFQGQWLWSFRLVLDFIDFFDQSTSASKLLLRNLQEKSRTTRLYEVKTTTTSGEQPKKSSVELRSRKTTRPHFHLALLFSQCLIEINFRYD